MKLRSHALALAAAALLSQLDVHEMLDRRTTDWQIARLRGNPAVLVIEFPNLAEQGAAMNRIAALLEKAGAPRDRVLNDAALAELIRRHGDNPQTFYQGHNYVAAQLARFYTMAARQGQSLNLQEERLRKTLVDAHVLGRDGDATIAQGLQAVVSYTATQRDDPTTRMDESIDDRRRESVLRHELSHGLYFTNRAYRDHCWRFWRERLTEDERERLRRMLVRLNYDGANEDLTVNEAQAFLMHTPDDRAFNAASLGIAERQLSDLRRRFMQGAPRLRELGR